MRYRLRSLLILLAITPPVLAGFVLPAMQIQYRAWQWREVVERAKLVPPRGGGLIADDKSSDWTEPDFSGGFLPMTPVEEEPTPR